MNHGSTGSALTHVVTFPAPPTSLHISPALLPQMSLRSNSSLLEDAQIYEANHMEFTAHKDLLGGQPWDICHSRECGSLLW